MIIVAPLAGLGLLIGSFLNVVIHRVPRGLSIVAPPSACPGCGSAIAPRDNVPVLSWLMLRGRCRHCRMGIPIRYPAVELLTGVSFALVALAFGAGVLAAPSATGSAAAALRLGALCYLAAISIALAAIDVELKRLPDAIVLPAYGVGVLLLGAADLLSGDLVALARAAAVAGCSVLLYLVLALAKPGGMGLGDVKLAGVLGLFLGEAGIGPAVVGTAGAFVLGGVVGIALMASGRIRRGGTMPFGPWMLAGAWVGLLWGEPLWAGYLALFGLA